jgi:putative YhdH/YhfP family quinone oxidoreductase
MERLGLDPPQGPILVTGATGGVGSLAVALLSARGYEVTAATRKAEAVEYLRSLGASAVVDPAALAAPGGGPLASGRWAGAIDNVGGALLAEVLRAVRPWGVVASVGLAGGHALQTTVMPFSLLGIDSVDCPMPLRREVWARLAAELPPERLARVATTEIGLEEVPAAAERLLAGEGVGRTLVRLGP